MAYGLGDEILWVCPTISESASDLSGNAYNGTLENGASIVLDRDNNNGIHAIALDGANDRVDFPYISSMDQTSQLGVSLWIYRESNAFDFYLTKGSSSARTPYIRSLFDGTIEITLDLYDGATSYRQTIDSYGAGIYDEWIHIALCWDGVKTTLYANGTQISSTTNSSGLTTKPDGGRQFKIGILNGKVDDVRIYNNSLSLEEVKHLSSHRGVENKPAVGLINFT